MLIFYLTGLHPIRTIVITLNTDLIKQYQNEYKNYAIVTIQDIESFTITKQLEKILDLLTVFFQIQGVYFVLKHFIK